ncbi:MAG: LytR/AlgR family response regulator transcription factor [Bacteroidales bacterium]
MKIYRHIIFLIAVIIILTYLFNDTFGSRQYAFYFISMLLPIIAGTFYFLNYYLIPRFFFQGKYLFFSLYFFYTLVISIYLEMIVMFVSFVFFAEYNLGQMGPYASDIIFLAIVMYLIVFAGSFVLLIQRLRLNLIKIQELDSEKKKLERGFIDVRSERKNVKVYYDSILFIESLSDYIKFMLDTGEIMSREKISHIEKLLPSVFLRCHRSFIVNTEKIEAFNYDYIEINGNEIPISRTYKKTVMNRLRKKTT